jgi:hypothetical protein
MKPLGKADYVEICHYTVVADASPVNGVVSLEFAVKTVGSYKCQEGDTTSTRGWLTPVWITVSPEPATIALLALGGLVAARRRR